MAYPHTRLTRPIRIAIMVFLILLFFTISPLVILYTAGYRYDLHTHNVQKTGVISIDISPNDASVLINDVVIAKKMPIRLANRAPGKYSLTIQKPGYHALHKDIEVQSKQTTYIRDLTLFKDALPATVFDKAIPPSTSISVSFDGKYIALAAPADSQPGYDVQLFDTDTGTQRTLLRVAEATKPILEWSPRSHMLLIRSLTEQGPSFQLIDVSRPDRHQFSKIFLTSSTLAYQWSEAKNTQGIYTAQSSTLYFMTTEGVNGSATVLRDTWFIDGAARRWEFDPKESLLSVEETGKTSQWRLTKPITSILAVKQNFLLAKNGGGIAIIHFANNNIETQDIPTTGFRYNPRRDEWLSWSSSEVWRIDNQGRATLLTRLSSHILDVQSMDQEGTLLITTDTGLIGFYPDFFNLETLFSHGKVEISGVNQKKRSVYFVGQVGNAHNVFELSY